MGKAAAIEQENEDLQSKIDMTSNIKKGLEMNVKREVAHSKELADKLAAATDGG